MPLLSLFAADTAPEVRLDVRRRLRVRRAYMDRWFLAVRVTLGLGLIGYLTMDMLALESTIPVSVMLLVSYLLANLGVWLMMGQAFRHARWVFAGLDLTTLLVLRHLFQFEALVDPNATMVGLLTLMLIAYALYSDPRLSGILALTALTATVATLVTDAIRHSPPSTSLISRMLAYRSHPLRALLLFTYLGIVGLVTHRLAQRLYDQVVAFSTELYDARRRRATRTSSRTEAQSLLAARHDLAQALAPLRTALTNLREGSATSDPEMVGIAVASSERLHHLKRAVDDLYAVVRDDSTAFVRKNVSLEHLLDALLPPDDAERFIVRGARPLTVCVTLPPALFALRHLLNWGLRATPDQHPITLRCRADGTDGDTVTLTLHAPAFQLEPTTLDAIDSLVAHVDEEALFPSTSRLDVLLIQRALDATGGALDVDPSDQQETVLRCVLPGRCASTPTLDADDLRDMLDQLPLLA